MYEMTIRTEDSKGAFTVKRTVLYSEDAVVEERAHQRAMAPRGATQEITVKALTR